MMITFDRTITLGALRLWNYAKTPARGAKSFSILLDDRLIFEGVMRGAPPRASQGANGASGRGACLESDGVNFVQTVIFTDNQQLIDAEHEHVYNKVQPSAM